MKAKVVSNTASLTTVLIQLAVSFVLLLTIATYLLSLFNLVNTWSVWGLVLLSLLAVWFFYRNTRITFDTDPLKLVLPILVLTFIQGLGSAPTTTDAMVYHLPRVIFWSQAGSVYQTVAYTAHDFMPPVSGFLMLFWYLLTGSDRLVFLTQWLAYLFSLIATLGLAKTLAFSRTQERLSVVMVATLPIAVLQATSTQIDLVLTFFVVASAFFGLRFYQTRSLGDWSYFLITLSLGVLSKQTFILFSPLWLLLSWPTLTTKAQFWSRLSLLCLPLLLILPYLFQNYALYHSLVGPDAHSHGQAFVFTNQTVSLSALISNLLRNLLLQLPVPFGQEMVMKLLGDIHVFLGIALNDPRTTWGETTFALLRLPIPQEDIAASPLYVTLAVIASFFVSRSRNQPLKLLTYSVGASFVLLALLLKWQPYHARVHLPILWLFGPSIGFAFARWQKISYGLMTISYTIALVFILANVSHPYVDYSFIYSQIRSLAPATESTVPTPFWHTPRDQQYFRARPYWQQPYQEAAHYFSQQHPHQEVTLSLIDGYLYPLWVALEKNDPSVTIKSAYASPSAALRLESHPEPVGEQCWTTTSGTSSICLVEAPL